MPTAQDLAELRELHARAYGRGGVLSAADAVRMGELEALRARALAADATAAEKAPVPPEEPSRPLIDCVPSEPAVPSAPSPLSAPSAPGEPVAPADADPDAAGGATGAEGDEEPAEEPAGLFPTVRDALRRRWPVAALGVVLVILGIGAGWLLFARHGGGEIALTAEQESWRAAIAADGGFDQGSLRAVGEEMGVIAWVATKDGGESTCLLLGDDDNPTPFCAVSAQARLGGLHGGFTVDRDGTRFDVSAQVLLTQTGEPALRLMSGERVEPSGNVYATEEETRIAAQLADQGYDPNSLWVVGYDGTVPIWTATRWETQENCLILDGGRPDPAAACRPFDAAAGGDVLTLHVADAATGAVTEYILSAPGIGPSYLQIVRGEG